jgi:hypothetical protein
LTGSVVVVRRSGRSRTVALRSAARCLVVVGLLALVGACASVTPGALVGVRVDVEGRRVHDGPAAFTVRVEGREARPVVSLRGVGEVLVDVDGCRFVRVTSGGALTVSSHVGPCSTLVGDRLCFRAARFLDAGGAPHVVVDGCADRNELFLDRVDIGSADTGLAPRTFVERCAAIDAADAHYVGVVAVVVDDNDQPWRGLRLRYDGDGFGVCFLSAKEGRYRIDVVVEDPRPRSLTLIGAVDEL